MTENIVVSTALKLAAQGFPVFPAGARDGLPRCPYPGLNRLGTTNPGEIAQMDRQYGFEQLGVILGKRSGIAVLRIDRTPEASSWWPKAKDRMPATRRQRLRGGGLELMFRHEPHIKPGQFICEGIEAVTRGWTCWAIDPQEVCDPDTIANWPDWLAGEDAEQSLKRIAGFVVCDAAKGDRPEDAGISIGWWMSAVASMVQRGEITRRQAEAAMIEAGISAGMSADDAAAVVDRGFGFAFGCGS